MTDSLDALPEDWDRALAVVAHPDDLEFGAASAIARWTAQGKIVTYLLVTDGEAGIDSMDPAECGPLRRQEEIDSGAPPFEVGVSGALRRDCAQPDRRAGADRHRAHRSGPSEGAATRGDGEDDLAPASGRPSSSS